MWTRRSRPARRLPRRAYQTAARPPCHLGQRTTRTFAHSWEHVLFSLQMRRKRAVKTTKGSEMSAALSTRLVTRHSDPAPCDSPAVAQLAPRRTVRSQLPPQNLDAEESVLGAMMLSPGAIGRGQRGPRRGRFLPGETRQDLPRRPPPVRQRRAGRRDHAGRRARPAE